MSSKRVKNKYHCKQTELYAVAVTYFLGVLNYLTDFTNHNTTYTAASIGTLQLWFEGIKAIPNFQQRNQPSETLRVDIKAQGKKCLKKWRKLRTYIERGYTGDSMKPMLEAAGWSYLAQASAYNWEDLNELIETGKEFLAAREAELILVGMPATFKAEYELEFTAFTALFNQIPISVLGQRIQTDEKTEANNSLYDKLMEIGKDANVIFEDQAAIRESFTFSKVLEVVSSSEPAQLKGNVTDVANNPISGVNVILETLDVEIVTDENGDYDSGNIPSGEYKLKFEKDGFVPFELGIIINKGVTKTQNAVLTAV